LRSSAEVRRPRIAIDAMGGDHAPKEIVLGTLLAAESGELDALLVGDERRLRPLVPARSKHVAIVHAPKEIAMDASPSQALRGADETSLGIAVNLVRDGGADAVVSAGNSGAFLAVALIRLRTIAGIARPAIAAVLPAQGGPIVILDAGANVDCRPEWLVQFGVMGSAYAHGVLGIAEPKVGIISVGEERVKGNAQVIEAASGLDRAPITFVGNVEGKDVFARVADVFVTDGFVGNVMLKLSEGLAGFVSEVLADELRSGSPLTKAGAFLATPALRRVRRKLDYDTYGGAPLLGLRGNCIVAHGRANRRAMRSAIFAAASAVREDVVGQIEQLLSRTDVPNLKAAP
jgi:glycerol-3-phosphate acyltransferase PlsX